MGDYNIDLLKHDNHLQTCGFFLNNMHSNSPIPLIYKPTREAKTTATLIDSIFSNNYNVSDLLLQRLLITDISDHYAISISGTNLDLRLTNINWSGLSMKLD